MNTYRTSSSRETKELASRIAKDLLRGISKHAAVLSLRGELGSGKTTFVQGFLKGLGTRGRAQSPTFILARRTALRAKRFKNFFHVDAYRLKGDAGPFKDWLRTLMADPQNIVAIEWPERLRGIMPKHALRLRFAHGRSEEERKITMQ